MTEVDDHEYQYRLSWMTVGSIAAAELESEYGRDIWSAYNWDLLDWWPVEILFLEDELEKHLTQARQLAAWWKSHEQPIRDVVLERRPVSIEWEGVDLSS